MTNNGPIDGQNDDTESYLTLTYPSLLANNVLEAFGRGSYARRVRLCYCQR